MTKESFTAAFEHVDPEPGFDGMAAVMNMADRASGTVVGVTDIKLSYPCGFNADTTAAGCQGYYALVRTSAQTGGEAITPYKFDTSAASLPSQVSLAMFPTSVTEAGTLREYGDAQTFTYTLAIPFQAMLRAPGICDRNDHTGRTAEGMDVWHADGLSDTEPIVLREGEGCAFVLRAWGVPQAHHWAIVVRVSGTGNSYRYVMRDCGTPYFIGQAAWGLFNDTGSGVVLQVYVASKTDLGEHNLPRYRVTRIAGIVEGGSSVTPSKHDTSASLTGLVCTRGAFRAFLGQDGGFPYDYLGYQTTPCTIAAAQSIGTIRQYLHAGPMITLTGAPIQRFAGEFELWPGERRGALNADDTLWIMPGEGLAVIGGGNGLIETGAQAYANIEVTGYVWTPDAAAGNTYSRARVVNA